MLDLGGREGAVEAERGYEVVGELVPVFVGIGYVMSVEVAGGASELGRIAGVKQVLALHRESGHEDFYLFAQAGGGSRLAVGMGEHRHVFPLLRQSLKSVDHIVENRHISF